MIVTCDVVEAGATADSSMIVDVDSSIDTTGFSTSLMFWAVSALLISEVATATDTAWVEPVANVVENVQVQETLLPQANLSVLIVDKAATNDTATAFSENNVVESATGTDSVVVNSATLVRETATATDTALTSATATNTLVERGTAYDDLLGYNDYIVADTADADDVAVLSTSTALTVVDDVYATTDLVLDAQSGNLLIDGASADDALLDQLDATTTVVDGALGTDRALFDMASLGWVMNSETCAMSRYTPLPFSSVAVVNGRVLGLGDAGLYELAGETDLGVPVNAYVTTGRSMLGTNNVKRIPNVYVSGSAAGQLDLSVSVYGQYKGTFTYSMVARQSDAPRGHRITLGRGLASVYWKFKLANKNGARFEIDTINADVAPSTNRRV